MSDSYGALRYRTLPI